MASPAQIRANRTNAQKSTGPITRKGKQTSSRNAMTHGLTSVVTVLPNENKEAFEAFLAGFVKDYAPGNEPERFLVEQMAHHAWCLIRARSFEAQLDTYDMIMWKITEIEAHELELSQLMHGLDDQDGERSYAPPDAIKRKEELVRRRNDLVALAPFMRGETDAARDRLARHEERHLHALIKLMNQFPRMRALSSVPALLSPDPGRPER